MKAPQYLDMAAPLVSKQATVTMALLWEPGGRLTNILVLTLVLSSSFFLLYSGVDRTHLWGDDFSAYIMQAQSLVHGNPAEFMAANRFTIEQSSRLIGPVAYPWGFPLLLAPIYAIFGTNIVAFKSLNLVCYLLFMLLLWYAWPADHSDLGRFIFVALFGWNPYFQEFMNQVLSDIPFLLFSTASVLLIRRVVVERRRLFSEVGDHLLLGLLIAATCSIRVNGFLLVVTLALTQFTSAVKKASSAQQVAGNRITRLEHIVKLTLRTLRSELWVLALPYISFALPAIIVRALLPQGDYSYLWTFKELSFSAIQYNIHHYIDVLPGFLTGVPHEALVFGATIPFAIKGVVQRRTSDYPMIFYGIVSILLYVFWPAFQGLRFLLPILPFYTYFVLVGLEQTRTATPRNRAALWKILRLSPALVVLLYFGRVSAMNADLNLTGHRYRVLGPYLPTAQQAFSFIVRRTEPNSVILFFKPRAMRLFTGRPSLMIREGTQVDRGDYLCEYLGKDAYNQLTFENVARLVDQRKLSLIYENPEFRLYRIHKFNNNGVAPGPRPVADHPQLPTL